MWWLLGAALFLEFSLPLYVMHYFTVAELPGHETFMSTGSKGGDLAYWFTLPFPPYRFLEFLVGMIGCVLLTRGALPRVRTAWAWSSTRAFRETTRPEWTHSSARTALILAG